MTDAKFEQLLYEEETPTLDFKRDQYPFAKATEEEKSELLKDILGMTNAWRRSEAYVLIGVDDVRGGRSTVYGVQGHLDDHALQQFVNNLTNRPVRFGYEAFGFEGHQIGIIRIEQQPRPVYLKRDYGKLRKNEVYVRRGSSTDPTKPATLDEVAQMGHGAEVVLVDLNGLDLELDYNRRLAAHLGTAFNAYIQKHGLGTNVSKPSPVPPQRFRIQAIQGYLQRPFLGDALPAKEVERYWEMTSLCNAMMDKVVGLTTVGVVDNVVASVMQFIPEMNGLGASLAAKMAGVKA
ncbi:MAG: helix-turn-helix domain-containing protein [Phycisphaerae bacterium]|nr:ATP-binding protein [Tepidisphaeraceae bacterium]